MKWKEAHVTFDDPKNGLKDFSQAIESTTPWQCKSKYQRHRLEPLGENEYKYSYCFRIKFAGRVIFRYIRIVWFKKLSKS
jgi:hypothetical protein